MLSKEEIQRLVGTRISTRRRALNMTQADLAGDEYTNSYISQVERGHVAPSLISLVYIAERLGSSIAYLLADIEPDLDAFDQMARRHGIDPGSASRLLHELAARFE